MTSLDRKTRAVNAQDIASQLKLKNKKSLKSLKSKNSELLSKYRQSKKDKHNSDDKKDSDFELSQEEVSDKKLIPKVTDSFQGVVFDNSDEDLVIKKSGKKPWKRRKKGNNSNSQKKSRFKKFKPFKRSKGSKKTSKNLNSN